LVDRGQPNTVNMTAALREGVNSFSFVFSEPDPPGNGATGGSTPPDTAGPGTTIRTASSTSTAQDGVVSGKSAALTVTLSDGTADAGGRPTNLLARLASGVLANASRTAASGGGQEEDQEDANKVAGKDPAGAVAALYRELPKMARQMAAAVVEAWEASGGKE